MPSNIEAEQAVLGSLLLSKEKYPEVDALINPGDFESEAHREIYECIKQLADEKHLTDRQGLILAGADRSLREILLIFRDDPIEGPLQEASMGVWKKILQEES